MCAVGDVFKALADPTRRRILDELTDRDGQTLFEICSRLAVKHGLSSSRQAISATPITTTPFASILACSSTT